MIPADLRDWTRRQAVFVTDPVGWWLAGIILPYSPQILHLPVFQGTIPWDLGTYFDLLSRMPSKIGHLTAQILSQKKIRWSVGWWWHRIRLPKFYRKNLISVALMPWESHSSGSLFLPEQTFRLVHLTPGPSADPNRRSGGDGEREMRPRAVPQPRSCQRQCQSPSQDIQDIWGILDIHDIRNKPWLTNCGDCPK